MQKLKMPEGEPIEHPIVNRSIAKAQNRVESRNFDIRKQLLEYDDVANDQRKVIYQQRNELLEATDVGETIENMVRGEIDDVVRRYVPPESVEDQWDVKGLETALAGRLRRRRRRRATWVKADSEITDETIRDRVVEIGGRAVEGEGDARRRRGAAPVRAQPDAADARPALARAPRATSTTCARASTCAATRRRTRSRSTSARRSSCSPTCSTASSTTS